MRGWAVGAAAVAVLAAGGWASAFRPEVAPGWVALSLLGACPPLAEAWRGSRGTALRGAILWMALAVALGLAAQAAAMGVPPETGRPAAGHWAYVATLAALAALLSILNARRPGGGAWAILMALLVVVFLIPWLEARGGGGLARLRLGAPWTIFYGLLAVAGVSNYLPTRYGPAALVLGFGFGLEYAALTSGAWSREARASAWSAVPWTLALAIWAARWRSGRRGPSGSGLDAAWGWFRDHWGVAWAFRVQERFNREAETLGWPIRLAWRGAVPAPGVSSGEGAAVPDGAEETLRGLLRRFADPDRVDEEAARGRGRPCGAEGIGR